MKKGSRMLILSVSLFIAAIILVAAAVKVGSPATPEALVPHAGQYNSQGSLPACADEQPPHCQGANLANSNLQGVDLSNLNLSGADLSHANLQYADLENSTLTNANLDGANLQNADLVGADTTGANTATAIYCNTLLPDGSLNSDDCSE